MPIVSKPAEHQLVLVIVAYYQLGCLNIFYEPFLLPPLIFGMVIEFQKLKIL
jgi:hypothetical protein